MRLRAANAQACGCDFGVGHICDEHAITRVVVDLLHLPNVSTVSEVDEGVTLVPARAGFRVAWIYNGPRWQIFEYRS